MRWVRTGVVLCAAGIAALWLVRPDRVVRRSAVPVAAPTADDAAVVAGIRFFFAHHSVGQSMLDALPSLFARLGVAAPRTAPLSAPAPDAAEPVIVETTIGANGDPLGKIAEFDRMLRAGLVDRIDVALLKLCFVDVHAGTDVAPLFAAYRDTLARLARDHPSVVFLAATVPLMHERGVWLRAKRLLGRGREFDPVHNAVRERYNRLVRDEYAGTGRLFDIATVEAVGTTGVMVTRGSGDGDHIALRRDLATDSGHVNDRGAALLAGALVAAVAAARPREAPPS